VSHPEKFHITTARPPESLQSLAGRRQRRPRGYPRPEQRGHCQRGDRQERDDRQQDGRVAGRSDAEKIEPGQRDDEGDDQEPALERRHLGGPEAQVLDEERRVYRDVDEAIDPAPPADLEGPVRPKARRVT
jgi:hypothetical protein